MNQHSPRPPALHKAPTLVVFALYIYKYNYLAVTSIHAHKRQTHSYNDHS